MQSAKSPSTDYLADEEHILNFLSRELEIKFLFRGEKKKLRCTELSGIKHQNLALSFNYENDP